MKLSDSPNPCYLLSTFPHLFPLSPNLGEKLKRNWFSPHFVNLKATAFCSFPFCFFFFFLLLLNHNYNWISAQINSRPLFKWAQINQASFRTLCNLLCSFPQTVPLLLQDLQWNHMSELQGQSNALWLSQDLVSSFQLTTMLKSQHTISIRGLKISFSDLFLLSSPLNLTCSPSAEAI